MPTLLFGFFFYLFSGMKIYAVFFSHQYSIKMYTNFNAL